MFGYESYKIRVYIVGGYSPFLLSHADMDRIGLSYHSLEKEIWRPSDGYHETVIWQNNLPYLPIVSVSLFSEQELMRIHRSLGHAKPDRIMDLLRPANHKALTDDIRGTLEKLVENCKSCAMNQPKPRRFLFSSRYQGTGEFNSAVYVDIMSLDGNVLYVVCAGTNYQAGHYLENMRAETVWAALCMCWIHVYAGAPDDLYHDAGTNFASSLFREHGTGMCTRVHEVPTEAHHTIGVVERQHGILRTIYNKLRLDEPDINKKERLLLTFRCVNDAPGPGGISPTLLVYSVFPKLPLPQNRDTSLARRVKTISECTKLAKELKAKQIIKDSVNLRNVTGRNHIQELEKLIPGDEVMVYRKNAGWKIYPFVKLESDGVVVQLDNRQSKFSLTACRVFNPSLITNDTEVIPLSTNTSIQQPLAANQSIHMNLKTHKPIQITPDTQAKGARNNTDMYLLDQPEPEAMTVRIEGANENTNINFTESRKTELAGLLEMNTFEPVPLDCAKGHRIYDHVFVDKKKESGQLKSRLCVRAFNDREHGLQTFSPTVQRMTTRFLYTVAKLLNWDMYVRDITQAFIQSSTKLRRPIFLRPPKELNLPPNQVLRVLRPLYGVPESPLHWFVSYTNHHRLCLNMLPLSFDQCMFHTKAKIISYDNENTGAPKGLVCLQVDDTIFTGNEEFITLEAEQSKKFPSKGRSVVCGKPITFNGITIRKEGNIYVISCKVSALPKSVNETMSFDELRSVRAKLAYVAHTSAPLILYGVSKLSQVTKETFASEDIELVQSLMHVLKHCNEIHYTLTRCNNMELGVCVDASFASNKDLSSQLGVLCFLRDCETGICSILHFISFKSRRVCRSVLAAELLAMIEGFDIGFTLCETYEAVMGTSIPLSIYTDSRSLYHLTVSLTRTKEKRMQIDLQVLRQAYERREITNVVWITGESNPADGLTKINGNGHLKLFLVQIYSNL